MGDSAPSPIILQPKPIIVQKNFKEIPENWLEIQLSAFLQWEIQEGSGSDLSSVFRIYDENDLRLCLCQFIDCYHSASPSFTLNSYFSNGITYKKPEKNQPSPKYLDKHKPEECKIMGDLLKSPNTPIAVYSSVNLANQYYSHLITRIRTGILPGSDNPGTHIAASLGEPEKIPETKISAHENTSINGTPDSVRPPDLPHTDETTKLEADQEKGKRLYNDIKELHRYYSKKSPNGRTSGDIVCSQLDSMLDKHKSILSQETQELQRVVNAPHGSSAYHHLIETETLPTIGQYYRCKEHPDVWNKDLDGLEISHFIPFHTDKGTKARSGGDN